MLILPDGTTLLVDAGAAGDGLAQTDPHPDASRTPGAWIARYVMRHLPARATGIDYAVITHFLPDHMGQITAGAAASKAGCLLSGTTEVGDALPVGVLVDRGWPDYSYPAPFTDRTMVNYRQFLAARAKDGMKVERFQPGSMSQIRRVHDGEVPGVWRFAT